MSVRNCLWVNCRRGNRITACWPTYLFQTYLLRVNPYYVNCETCKATKEYTKVCILFDATEDVRKLENSIYRELYFKESQFFNLMEK